MKHVIFISYRRADAEGEAGRLYDDLVRAYSEDTVFMDVAGIAPGIDFRKAIDDNVAACGVFLAVIGPLWATITDASGHRRLEDPDDFVLLEVASALRRNIPVIPVLVHEATMPHPDMLPESIKDLAYRNSVEISHARWNSDVQLLVQALKQYVAPAVNTETQPVHATIPVQLPPPSAPALPPRPVKSNLRLVIWIAAGFMAVLFLVGIIGYFADRNRIDAENAAGHAGSTRPSQAATVSAAGSLAGMWRNSSPRSGTDALVTLRISGTGPQYLVEPSGDCLPNGCSWGAQTVVFDGNEAAGSWTLRHTPEEVTQRRVAAITIRPAGGDLDVQLQNTWSNAAGQIRQNRGEFRFVRVR